MSRSRHASHGGLGRSRCWVCSRFRKARLQFKFLRSTGERGR